MTTKQIADIDKKARFYVHNLNYYSAEYKASLEKDGYTRIVYDCVMYNYPDTSEADAILAAKTIASYYFS